MDLLEIRTAGNIDRTRHPKWETNKRRYITQKIRHDGTYRHFYCRCLHDLSGYHQTRLIGIMDILFTLVASVLLIIGFFVICRASDDEEDQDDNENVEHKHDEQPASRGNE